MDFSKARLLGTIGGMGLAIGGGASPALAQAVGNPGVQTFFENTVCGPSVMAVPLFLARCGETEDNGVFANISTNSESSLNPNQTAVAASNALAKAQALAQETEARLEAIRGEDAGKPGADSGTIASFGPWGVFANIEGEWFDQSRRPNANERGFDGRRYRATLGGDYRLGAGSHLGLMLSYEDTKSNFDAELPGAGFTPTGDAGGMKAETIAATVFASFSLSENAWFDASAGYAWSDNDFRRNAIFQPSTRTLTRDVRAVGSADGKQYFVAAGAGFDLSDGPMSFGPYVRARYVKSKIDGYAETDLNSTGLQLEVDRQKASSLTTVIGASASYAISASWGVVVPQARLEYEHEFKDDARATITRFALDPNDVRFAVTTDAPDRNYFNAGLGLLFVLPNGVMPFVDYEGLFGYRNFDRHRVTLGLRLEI
jgi:outer membrane autotransporter protein